MVVSILPANLHPIIAKVCINEGTHMVTASYMSNEVKDLHQQATTAGVTILNEVGLDPGMLHFIYVVIHFQMVSNNHNIAYWIVL